MLTFFSARSGLQTTTLCALMLASVLAPGCGDDDGAAPLDAGVVADAGGRDAASVDAAGLDAAPPDAAGAADAGTHDAGPPCPAMAPAMGATCSTVGQTCAYLDCGAGGAGAITAVCGASGWTRTTMACTEVTCGTATCAAGELCVERASGAFIQICEASPCGTGPIEEACACTLCSAGCTVDGFNVHCISDCPLCP